MKKIIIFGGSFDPIHNGHIQIALNAFKKVNADKLFFVLSFNSPDKKIHRASWDERLEMLKIGIKKFPNFYISTFESETNEISYTWKTIEFFKNKFPNHEIFFLMGSDQYKNFNKWEKNDYIKDNSKIICHSRESFKIIEKNIIFINKTLDFSSSESIINPKGKLDNEVLDYINENSIYSIFRLKKEKLSEERIKHCIDVANLAKEFSNKYNDKFIKKAYCSGIYHDIAKEMKKNKLVLNAKKILDYNNYPSWKVIHAPMGKYILEKKYLFKDSEVLDAILYHTIPREQPTLLEKIVFCADKLSFRKDRPENKKLIRICKKNINKGYDILLELNKEWVKK